MTSVERIDVATGGATRAGHEFRYRLAAGYIETGEAVLDAACGVGYGAALVPQAGRWVGVDIEPVVDDTFADLGRWVVADLCEWEPDEHFDVALSFETLEHLERPEVLVDTLCRVRRLVICSVPIVPTADANPFHRHDFTMWDLPRVFDQRGWVLHHCVLQPSELSAVYVFTRA